MKNADKPAMPCTKEETKWNGGGGRALSETVKIEEFGLTKREMFAMHAMHGELAGSANHSRPEPGDVASFAVKCADALLAELDK